MILAAGVGSRIKPLTDNCPKSLLRIDGKTILEMMLSHIQGCGINEVILVVGYLQEQIKGYVKTNHPDLNVNFVTNERYAETNTGYSLMLTKDLVQDSTFIKFDADVVFEQEILKKLIECEYENCLCFDKNINLDAEEIKVHVKDHNRVVKVGKAIDPEKAAGESIGIEKIGSKIARVLFTELEKMMANKKNHQKYYEGAYEILIARHVPFYALDITGFKWVEIDTQEDFITAKQIFSFDFFGHL